MPSYPNVEDAGLDPVYVSAQSRQKAPIFVEIMLQTSIFSVNMYMSVRKYKTHTKESLQPIVSISTSWRDVLSKLGYSSGYRGSQTHIKKRAISLGVDFSHFKGARWNKGMLFPPKRPITDYFEGAYISSNSLKKRIVKEGLKEWKCERCSNTEWLGEKIPLELHHIDHNPKNNKLDNLKLVCPNCHYKEHNPTAIKVEKIKKARAKRKQSYRARKKLNRCLLCEQPCADRYCSYACYNKAQQKVNRPSKEELEQMIRENSFLQIGKQYGVSDNAVRKWAKQYGIDLSISKFRHKL